MPDVIDEEEVWDVFDHLINTRTRGRLHLPTDESTLDEPKGRCDRCDEAADLKPSPTSAIPRGHNSVCKFCLADFNGTEDELRADSTDPKDTRKRIGEIVESMGGTPP